MEPVIPAVATQANSPADENYGVENSVGDRLLSVLGFRGMTGMATRRLR